ncbi:AraC-like DNA-binding protein [Sphingobacterium allocomposti]|jgi:AraC-like DNA-binding protein|uniref:AraC-like DNA-binding protein n=1 Tax=Sphingobacterium allocomposti TaxID=415956 RepID=A0A5S5DDV7_9SPHI|nr:AraC family transcriptional regulator [Sphingobacterium composti Yoo et al. 2007 non Ten et al. 2007]TYP94223.1 AraC-like DNA-binding protein [Sphingobacterium composti Yoo et al. 2007 non Ten et al. 2007]HLS96431.1 AraC family transcriptional regulator [Sphingobacterium sp.]
MKNHDYRRPIEFTVPAHGDGAFYVMEDIGPEFYGYYHRHREFQLSYLLKGNGSFMIGNLIRPCLENEIFLIKPNDPHLFFKGENAEEEQSIHIVHLFFSLERLAPFFEMAELQAIRSLFYHIPASKLLPAEFAIAIRDAFSSLHRDEGPHKLIKILEIFDYLRYREKQLISLYSGLHKIEFHDSDGQRINTVIKYAIDNFKRNVTVEEVSSLIHMTPTAFCKFFKKHTKKTFVSFLNEIRIEKACQLLVNKRVESISEAAYQCGFNTAVHFNRVFRSIMKESPSEFIAQHAVER